MDMDNSNNTAHKLDRDFVQHVLLSRRFPVLVVLAVVVEDTFPERKSLKNSFL